MKFSGQYLTFLEYLDLGGTLKQTPFNLLEYEARRKIDGMTQNRLKNANDIPKEVKMCMFNILQTLTSYLESKSSGISSETVGSYSVTYKDVRQIIDDKDYEIDNIIIDNLYGVFYNNEHLIYGGI